MNLKENYELVKKSYPHYVVLIKSGEFWCTFGSDSVVCKYAFNYALKNWRVAFPNKVLSKNLSKLRKLSISYVLVYKLDNIIVANNSNNLYAFYFALYVKKYNAEIKFNSLIKLIKYKVNHNICYLDYIYDVVKNS